MADRAVEVGEAAGLTVEVFNRDQLAAMGCGGIVGVNAGSARAAADGQLTYTPRARRPAISSSSARA